MKVVESTDGIFHTSGVSGKFDYKVASTAKMMNMLSNSLYKDKISAVLRELGTNARDSHIAAGQTRPFDVILPTSNKLELRIRDYGTGMAPDKMETMYRHYGVSDKTESNDFNGCMGIGSKSPFAYSSSFTSISYHNGKKYTYINAKDERGIPSLNRLNVEDTTEPNGLEIVLAVKQSDVNEFLTKSRQIYRPFPLTERPNVTVGGSKVEIDTHVFKMTGTNWGFRGTGDRYTNANSYVVMGCVEYPIDIQHFVKQVDNSGPKWYNNGSGVDTDYSKLIRMGLNLTCDIGEVEMDISREGLQYTKATIDHLKKMLDTTLTEIKAEISKLFISCKTLWDARILYYELIHGDLRKLQDIVELTKPEWQGKKIELHADVSNIKNLDIICFTPRGGSKAYKNTYVRTIEPDNNIKFIKCDIDKGAHAACTRLCNEEDANGKLKYSKVYLISFNNDAAIEQQFVDALGIDPGKIELASALPKPARQVRGPIEKVFSYSKAGTLSNNRSFWQGTDLDIEDGGFFVEISAWRTVDSTGAEKGPNSIKLILDSFDALGIKLPTTEVIGVKTISVKKFRKRDDIWTDFFDWAKKELDKHLKQSKITDDIALVNDVDEVSNRVDKYVMVSKIANPTAKVDSEFYKFTNELAKAVKQKQQIQSKISAAIAVTNTLGLSIDDSKKSDTLVQKLENVIAKYPMFELVERWHVNNKDNAKLVTDYINLVDNCCP